MMAKRLLKNSIHFFPSNIGLKLAREMENTTNVIYNNFKTNPCLNKLSLLDGYPLRGITSVSDLYEI